MHWPIQRAHCRAVRKSKCGHTSVAYLTKSWLFRLLDAKCGFAISPNCCLERGYEVSLGCAPVQLLGALILENNMKKLVLAAALTAAASTSFAGGVSEPIIEAPVIIEEASSSSTGILLPLVLLALVAAAISD